MSSSLQCDMTPSMESRPPARARRLSLVLFVCAALGAIGTTLGLAGLASWNQPLPDEVRGLELALPQAPEGEEESWRRVEEAYREIPASRLEVLREKRPLLNSLAAVNFVASFALLFGTLSTRIRGAGGLRLLQAGLTLSQAYAVLAALVQGWVEKGVLDAHRRLFQPLLDEGGVVGDAANAALIGQGAVLVVGVAAMLGQFVFYVWAQRYFRRPEVIDSLGTGIRPPAPPQR